MCVCALLRFALLSFRINNSSLDYVLDTDSINVNICRVRSKWIAQVNFIQHTAIHTHTHRHTQLMQQNASSNKYSTIQNRQADLITVHFWILCCIRAAYEQTNIHIDVSVGLGIAIC